MDVMTGIDDLLDEVDTTTEALAAGYFADAMMSVRDLIEHAAPARLGIDSASYAPHQVAEPAPAIRHTLVAGIWLSNVHAPGTCGGRTCVIHNPSRHHMDTWPLHWRNDSKLFERICECGVGHPDPDQFDYWDSVGQGWKSCHGCDGCCFP